MNSTEEKKIMYLEVVHQLFSFKNNPIPSMGRGRIFTYIFMVDFYGFHVGKYMSSSHGWDGNHWPESAVGPSFGGKPRGKFMEDIWTLISTHDFGDLGVYVYIIYFRFYIYLEPKWPLFWLEKALFWRVDLQE